MKVKTAINTFNKYLKAAGKSVNTIKSYNYDLKLFSQYLSEKKIEDIEQIDTGVIIDYLQTRDVSNNTKNRAIYALRQLFDCLILQDLYDRNPLTKIKAFKSESKPITTLSQDDETMLRGVVKDSPKWHAIIELMLYLPLRVSELCNLKESDVLFDEDRIIIRNSKNNKSRDLPINEKLRRILKQYKKAKEKQAKKLKWQNPSDYFFVGQQGLKLTPRSVRYNLKQFYKQAKINPQASSHTLRHTVCTRYGLKGMDPFTLRELAGHEDLKTTQRYVSVTIKNKREAIEKLND